VREADLARVLQRRNLAVYGHFDEEAHLKPPEATIGFEAAELGPVYDGVVRTAAPQPTGGFPVMIPHRFSHSTIIMRELRAMQNSTKAVLEAHRLGKLVEEIAKGIMVREHCEAPAQPPSLLPATASAPDSGASCAQVTGSASGRAGSSLSPAASPSCGAGKGKGNRWEGEPSCEAVCIPRFAPSGVLWLLSMTGCCRVLLPQCQGGTSRC